MTQLYTQVKLKQKPGKLTLLGAAIGAAMASPVAFSAQETEKKSEMEMIVVIGQATSGMDTMVSIEDLQNIQANDLSDVFRRDASVSVGGSVGMGQKIYVRNIGEDMLNISIDGAEQAGAVFHHSGRIAIEPELLKQVEIEAGAGSATAGPGALGGSVRFITKDPVDLLKAGESTGALVKGTYFSNGDGYKTSATVFAQDASERFSGMASFVGSDLDNQDDGDGAEILGTESKTTLGYVKFVADITDEHRLSISYESLKEEGDILYKPEWVAAPRNVPEPTEGTRETGILNYGFNAKNNDVIELSLNLYNTQQEQMREYKGTAYDGSVKSLGGTLQNKSLLAQHQLIYGINFRDDTSHLNDVDFTPSQFEETGQVKGVYVQDIFELNEQLTLSAGVRFDDYQLTDVQAQKFSDNGLSPNISANFAILPSLSVSAGYAEALRGVTVKDSFKLSSSTNAADLEAEKAKNYELGLDYFYQGFNLAAGIYDSTIENPIGGSAPWSKESVNLEHDIETQGYFIRADYSWNGLRVAASFNSADTEMNGEMVTRYVYSSSAISTGDTLVTDVSYEFNTHLLIGWATEFVASLDEVNLDVGGEQLKVEKPGYGVHDIYAHWMPMGVDSLTLSFTVKNLFNEQYLSHGSVEDFEENPGYTGIVGSPEAGRDIRLGAAFRF